MKHFIIIIICLAFTVTGCDNKAEAESERQARLKDMYRVPPPSDPAEDQWAKPGTTKPGSKRQ
jgi:uncharacterized lipoprotein NlpE involved in copper resistance